MQSRAGRLLALLLALILATGLVTAAAEDDWRAMLRDLYGLSDDYDGGDWQDEQEQTEVDNKQTEDDNKQTEVGVRQTKVEFALPITDPQQIVNYLSIYGELPENFITKREAKALGWDSAYNYVGDVAPGKSIGGDRFGNYEGLLPEKKGRTWYECDANYKGKKRGAQRVMFSSDGLYYYTDDHYRTFTQMFPEDGL